MQLLSEGKLWDVAKEMGSEERVATTRAITVCNLLYI